jgi:hypothetical protein
MLSYSIDPVLLKRFNPLRHVGAPMLLSAILGIACVAGGRYAWPFAVLPGATICVLGTRIAYDHRGAADYVQSRRMVAWWGVGVSVGTHRQIEGGVIFIFGAFLTILGITGIVHLVR